MKRFLLTFASSILFLGVASAAPLCVTGTMAEYIALGAGGCMVDDKLFSNFIHASTATGTGVVVADDDIVVVPLPPAPGLLNPGLLFSSGGWSVSDGGTVDSTILFDVTSFGGAIIDAHLAMAGGHVGDALGSVSETLVPPGLGLFVSTGGPFSDDIAFAPIFSTSVIKDILVVADLGTDNFATISAVTQRFSQIPEPTALLLMGVNLVAAGLVARRYRAKKS